MYLSLGQIIWYKLYLPLCIAFDWRPVKVVTQPRLLSLKWFPFKLYLTSREIWLEFIRPLPLVLTLRDHAVRIHLWVCQSITNLKVVVLIITAAVFLLDRWKAAWVVFDFWNFDGFWSDIRSAGGRTHIISYIGKPGCDGLILQHLGYQITQLVFGPRVLFVTKLEASVISPEGIPGLLKGGLSHLVVKVERVYCTDG